MPLFSEAFLNKEPTKLFLNPFGVTLHKPKVSSLSLKNVKSKLQEKESLEIKSNLEDLENEDIRHTIRNELTLEYYNEKVSELYPGLFVSGSIPANNKTLLSSLGITHIYNFAGNICENYFPSDFVYQKFYIKDSNNFNIESLFYLIFSEVQQILYNNGKVLFHCVQGVSRSVAFCIGYHIFSNNVQYEEALETCKNIRKISSPNIGFQVQLI